MSIPSATAQPSSPPISLLYLPPQTHRQTSFPDLSRKKCPQKGVSAKPNTLVDLTAQWNSSIAWYSRNGQLTEAAAEFTRMRMAGFEPTGITFVTLLSGCAHFPSKGSFLGASVHGYIRKLGLDISNVKIGTAIIDMYSKCGCVELSRSCFDEIYAKNMVCWNTMIDGYMRNGEFEAALRLFDEIPARDVVSWTSLICGFTKNGHFEQALDCFSKMQNSGVDPDYVTMFSVISACANVGMLGLGLWMHRFVLKHGFNGNIRVNNSLIDMYSRCGCIELAHQVFKSMPKRSLVSWNSIIVGFAINGSALEALEHFILMQEDGFKPDGVSFTGALTACTHAGFVDQGLKLFHVMKQVHKISPRIEHFGCVVDLYSRAGRLEDALNVIQMMPMKPNEVILGSLLAACRIQGHVSLAESLMNHQAKLNPGGDSNLVLFSNIYAAAGSWLGANNVRKKMKALGVQKNPGTSSIEIDCVVHEFVAGDKFHTDWDYIDAMLGLLSFDLSICGYVLECNNEMHSYEYD